MCYMSSNRKQHLSTSIKLWLWTETSLIIQINFSSSSENKKPKTLALTTKKNHYLPSCSSLTALTTCFTCWSIFHQKNTIYLLLQATFCNLCNSTWPVTILVLSAFGQLISCSSVRLVSQAIIRLIVSASSTQMGTCLFHIGRRFQFWNFATTGLQPLATIESQVTTTPATLSINSLNIMTKCMMILLFQKRICSLHIQGLVRRIRQSI